MELSVNCERIKIGFVDAAFVIGNKESLSSACFREGCSVRFFVPLGKASVTQRAVQVDEHSGHDVWVVINEFNHTISSFLEPRVR